MSNFKKIFAALIALVLVVGMLPFGTLAETHVETHSYTLPTAEASGAETPLIKIGAISDSHVDYTLQDNDPYMRPTFIKAMDVLKAEGIDLLVVGGDMVSGNEAGQGDRYWEKSTYDRVIAQYKKYASAASKTGKTLWVLGNHDYEVGMHNNDPTSEGSYSSYYGFVKTMIETNGQPKSVLPYVGSTEIRKNDWSGAHYVINGFDFVIINSPSQSYSAAILEWLDNTLAGIGANKTVFVLGHYPLQDNRGVTRPDAYGIPGSSQEAFKAVMNKYDNAIYLYGHNHGTHQGANPWIANDVFQRITHYDANGAVVNSRMVAPTSFITAFMGSAGYYDGALGKADPEIVQAMTITVYSDRIEFKIINCGVKNGGAQEPFVYTVYRNPLNNTGSTSSEIAEIYTLDGTITTATGWTKGNYALYYMDMKDGVLKNDWVQGSSYVNVPSGTHGAGTFDKRSDSLLRVYPNDGKTAVIQFTAPKSGIYKYEALVTSLAKTGSGSSKQIVYSVMKDGVIYDITQPKMADYNDVLSGTIALKKGETLLFLADQYVRYFNETNIAPNDRGPGSTGGWIAGTYSDLSVALLGGTVSDEELDSFKFDGSALNFTEGGFSLKNGNFSVTAIDYANKKTLSTAYGSGAALYNGNVTIAYKNADSKVAFGPFGSGNSGKNIASAIAFTAPAQGTYNLTALLLHEKDYDSATGKNSSIVYEILDKNFNVVFSGSTANPYTAVDVTDTLSRAAADVYLNKGETMYLVFRAASEATDLTSEAMATQVLSLDVTTLSLGCAHEWNYSTNKCNLCGTTCTHKYTNGMCTTCGKTCTHTWKNSKCTVCGKTCTHSWNNSKCTTCGKSCSHTWSNSKCTTCGKTCTTHTYKNEKCTTCGAKEPKNPDGMLPPNLSGTTAPDNTTVPDNTTDPDNTTVPDITTDPDNTTVPDNSNDGTTKPDTTTVPDTANPDDGQQDKGGEKDNSVLIAVLIGVACAIVIALILIFFIPKKPKK
ncbi:MAG: metallophosphoesterase [Clostridia bacterium]|nr:metallophosphoesterase [Clostridia bacterium]